MRCSRVMIFPAGRRVTALDGALRTYRALSQALSSWGVNFPEESWARPRLGLSQSLPYQVVCSLLAQDVAHGSLQRWLSRRTPYCVAGFAPTPESLSRSASEGGAEVEDMEG